MKDDLYNDWNLISNYDLIDSMDSKEFIEYMDSENFENFKSNLIRYCYDNNILLECYYLLGMVDYLCRVNGLPLDGGYDDIRKFKLNELLFPADVDFLCYLYNNNKPREEFIKKAIPEFLWYNIVESDIRNVA